MYPGVLNIQAIKMSGPGLNPLSCSIQPFKCPQHIKDYDILA